MSQDFDANAHYDLIDAEGIKVGEVRQGVYFEGDWKAGKIEATTFHYNERVAGSLQGLTVTRDDPDQRLTQFQLVPHKKG